MQCNSGARLQTHSSQSRFEQVMLPHLDAAYNLARWLVGNDQDAEDVVQEAYLRAFRAFDTFHGEDSRAWLFAIVRNTCYTWLHRNRADSLHQSFDEEVCAIEDELQNSERLLLARADHEMLREALEELPPEY